MGIGTDSDSFDPDLSGGRATIDLSALVANWKFLKSIFKGKTCGATVKANAYGLGISEVTKSLYEAGCRTFFTALPIEGMEVRRIAPDATIFILNGLMPKQEQYYENNNLVPTLGNLTEISEWFEFCKQRKIELSYAIQVETGMNRMGLSTSAIDELIQIQKRESVWKPSLVMTHLACADSPDHPLNSVQLKNFSDILKRMPDAPASMCNSAGVLLGSSYHFDIARPGIAIYGGNPVAGIENQMKPVVTLEAKILQIRSIEKGNCIGYGATCTLQRDSRIATISCGYADGYMRKVGAAFGDSQPYVHIKGHNAPVMGRVSMDQIQVDVTDLPSGICQRNDYVELYGHNISIDVVADWADTIDYELLVNIGSRVQKKYI